MSKDMFLLRKFNVPEIVYGAEAINLAAKYIKRFQASRAFIVTDPGLKETGWVNKLEKNLKSEKINYAVFDNVTPNPKDSEVMLGAEMLKREKCDIVLALGGGSPMDCAKAINITYTNDVSVNNFEGIDEVKTPGLPLVCIPTTAGTSADISQFAIITQTEQKRKFAIVSKLVVPDVALIDPETTLTMSQKLIAETGMEALVHAVEAFVSNASSTLTDINALKAIELISANLKEAYQDPQNRTYRYNMMTASLLAGMAFSNAGLGLVHALAHSLGGTKDFAHGECNAILLQAVIDYNFDSAAEKYFEIAKIFRPSIEIKDISESKDILIESISILKKGIGIDYSLKDIGVVKKDIKVLAEKAMMDGCLATNPKQVSLESIEECFIHAL